MSYRAAQSFEPRVSGAAEARNSIMSPSAFQMKRPGGDLGFRHVTKPTGIGAGSSQSTTQEMATHAALRKTNAQHLGNFPMLQRRGNEVSTKPFSIPQLQGRNDLLQGFHQRASGVGIDTAVTETDEHVGAEERRTKEEDRIRRERKKEREMAIQKERFRERSVEITAIQQRERAIERRAAEKAAEERELLRRQRKAQEKAQEKMEKVQEEKERSRREETRRKRGREFTGIPEADVYAERARGREGSALEKTGRERGGIHSTISKDLTTGDDARHATQLAKFGQKLSRFSPQARSMSTAQDSRERQDSREQSPRPTSGLELGSGRGLIIDSSTDSDEYEEDMDPEDSASASPRRARPVPERPSTRKNHLPKP